MKISRVLTGEPAQWVLGCSATTTLLAAGESGEWKAAALALAGQIYAALVAWRLAEYSATRPPDGQQ